MAISETCGSCGSSLELDRNDEVELWQSWRKSHKCTVKLNESFFSQATPVIESSGIGFAPMDLPGRRDTALDDE